MVDFSSSPDLYYAIGAGAVVLLLLVCCCCCCCRRRKNAKTKSPINSPVPYSVQHQVVDVRENEREYTMINETSPRESQKQIQNPVKPKSFSAKHLSPTVPSPSFSTAMTDSAGHTNTPQKQPPAEAAAPMEPSVPIEPTVPKPSGSSRAVVTTASILEDELIVASRLPFDTITALVLISKGGFGEVYKGSYRGNIVAIKRLLPESKRDMKQINAFLQEVKLMASLDHAHIVKFIGVAWDALSDVSVITEFMEGGDLRSVLNHFDQVQGRPLGFDKQKASIALHVAHALTYMHSLQPVVLHRDLKSKNILLDATQSVAKLTDFGVSRERSDRTMTAAVGTILWMAPEVMSGDHYDEKADVFSFGVVLSELDTYSMPYADVKARMVSESGRPLPDTALLQRIMTGRVTVSFSPELRSDVRALGQACVSVDPKMRPTAAQVLYELQKIERTMASEITFVL